MYPVLNLTLDLTCVTKSFLWNIIHVSCIVSDSELGLCYKNKFHLTLSWTCVTNWIWPWTWLVLQFETDPALYLCCKVNLMQYHTCIIHWIWPWTLLMLQSETNPGLDLCYKLSFMQYSTCIMYCIWTSMVINCIWPCTRLVLQTSCIHFIWP